MESKEISKEGVLIFSEKEHYFQITSKYLLWLVNGILYGAPFPLLGLLIAGIIFPNQIGVFMSLGVLLALLTGAIVAKSQGYWEIWNHGFLKFRGYDEVLMKKIIWSEIKSIEITFDNKRNNGDFGIILFLKSENKTRVDIRVFYREELVEELFSHIKMNDIPFFIRYHSGNMKKKRDLINLAKAHNGKLVYNR